MNDLVQDPTTSSAQSPRRKFSFKFPLGHGHSHGSGTGHDQSRSLDESGGGNGHHHNDGEGFSNKFGASGRHFSDELKNVTDIQVSLPKKTVDFIFHRTNRNSPPLTPLTLI